METKSLSNMVLLHPDAEVVLAVLQEGVQLWEGLLTGNTVVQPVLLRAQPAGRVHLLEAHAALPPLGAGLVKLCVVPELRLKGKHLGTRGTREVTVHFLLYLTPFPGAPQGRLLIQCLSFPSRFSFSQQCIVETLWLPFSVFGVSGVGLSGVALLGDSADVGGCVLFGMRPERQMMQEDSTADLTWIRLLLPSFGNDRDCLSPWGRLPAVRLLSVQVQHGCTLENHFTRAAAQQLRPLPGTAPGPVVLRGPELRCMPLPHMAVKSRPCADGSGTEQTLDIGAGLISSQ